jgi:hypothetical protein
MHQNTTVYPAKEYAWFMPTIVKNATHYALWCVAVTVVVELAIPLATSCG